MPLIQLQTSAALSEDQHAALLAALSKITAESIGKPEQYVMATISQKAILMSGQPGPAALVEVRSIGGLEATVNQRISQAICRLLKESLNIPPERIYLNFMDVPATHWGWRGDTFG